MLARLILLALIIVVLLGVVVTHLLVHFGRSGVSPLPASLKNEHIINPWNDLNALARGMLDRESVTFDVSIVPMNVDVSNNDKFAGNKSVLRRRVKTIHMTYNGNGCERCGTTLDLLSEIHLATKWWELCLQKALGKIVKLRVLGYEKLVGATHPPVSSMNVFSDAVRMRHNMGHIRICAWSFKQDAKLPNGVLMMCYRHGPDAADGYQGLRVYHELSNYLGNVHINTDVCWTTAANSTASGCYVLSHVLAHELGHAFGMGHDCSDRFNVQESGTWGGYFDCVRNLPATIMEPEVELNEMLPSHCGEWIQEHLRALYTAKRENYAVAKAARVDEVYRPLMFHHGGCDCGQDSAPNFLPDNLLNSGDDGNLKNLSN